MFHVVEAKAQRAAAHAVCRARLAREEGGACRRVARREERVELIAQLVGAPKDEPILLVVDELVEALKVIRADGQAAAIHVEHLHRQIEARGRGMEADAQIGRAE